MVRTRFEQRDKTKLSATPGGKGKKNFAERFKNRSSSVAVKALAWNVRNLRKKRGWSQEELAGECRIEQQSVSLIEAARANPTIAMVERLAGALGVSFVELFEAPPRLRRLNSLAK
jgi:ribosome-binding protein aMBF1 (putative translation factor)